MQGGKLRMLAITEATRKPNLPDMPTVSESGLPGYTAQTWLGLFGPAKLPPDVTAFLTAEAKKMLAKPEVRERLLAISSEPANGTAEELAMVLKRDLEKWRKTIRTPTSSARVAAVAAEQGE